MITRNDPFTRFMTLRDAMDRMLDEMWRRPTPSAGAPGMLPIDMFERQDELMIMAAVPGVKPEDVDISVSRDTMTIRTTVPCPTEQRGSTEGGNWYLHELPCGAFSRTISMPFPVAADKADARFENGMLYLRIPKAEELRPKRIQVKSGTGQGK